MSPVVLGSEHLPAPGSPLFSRPMLFVGNHQKMGFYDTPLLVYELYVRGYRWVRHRTALLKIAVRALRWY